MPIDFYYMDDSGPCQIIMMLADTLGIKLNKKVIDLWKLENEKPEYVKMNPQHCIPTINDNGFILWESRAILGYLVDQYAKDDSLYPKDPKKRAVVNQRLYFDLGTLYPKYADFYMPLIFTDNGHNPEHVEAFGQPIEILEKFLEGQDWAAGDQITIADYANGYDMSKHPNVHRWITKTKQAIPSFNDIVIKGIKLFQEKFRLPKNRAIIGYLVDQYAKDDSLYPKDPKKRAVVDQRLYFDLGTLYPKYTEFYRPRFFTDDGPNPEHVTAFGEPIALLEKFLEGKEWVAGDQITIADYVLVTTISHMEASKFKMRKLGLEVELGLEDDAMYCIRHITGNGYDMSKHPNVNRWLAKTKKAIPSFNDIRNKRRAQSINKQNTEVIGLCNIPGVLSTAKISSGVSSFLYLCPIVLRKKVNMPIELYYLPQGPICQSILMLAQTLDIKLDLKKTNSLQGETKTPEFLKVPVLIGGKSPNPEHIAAFGQPIELLEKFLEGQEWVAGNHITIADYAIVTTISIMEGNGYDMSKHPNVNRWLTKAKQEIPSYKDIVPPGIAIVRDMLKTGLK
ncbi:hypothetical protein C0J52_20859 [Blattella germanica]|nr:hypothetical protein C0J52_20859 [Blattella germanica]